MTPPGRRPTVDVVVVNWNGRAFLPECLRAVAESTLPGRVLVVDNASADGSRELIEAEHADVELVAPAENLGYAGGANLGIRRGHGDYVLIMNPDVRVAPGYIERLVDRLEAEPMIGMAQGRLLAIEPEDFLAGRSPGAPKLDSAGHSIRRSRMVVDRGQGRPDGPAWDTEASVFSVCGAAMLVRRATIDDVAVDGQAFDAAFFAYKEDIDLCWRARLRGWDARYVPDAVAWHVRGVPGTATRSPSGSVAARRHSWRNHWRLILKNDAWRHTLLHLPWILGWEIVRAGYTLIRDRSLLAAYPDIGRVARRALRDRRIIQGTRRARPSEIGRWFGLDALPAPPPPSTVRRPHALEEGH